MGKYETKNSSSVVRSFGAASAEMFQPEVNASSYQIRRRYFRLQKFIRLCIEMRYTELVMFQLECSEIWKTVKVFIDNFRSSFKFIKLLLHSQSPLKYEIQNNEYPE